MTTIVTAPENFEKLMMEDPYVIFLAGSFNSFDWRDRAITRLVDMYNGTCHTKDLMFLNPWRSDWKKSVERSWTNAHKTQIEWELSGMEQCNHVFVHLEKGVDSPVSLLWTGLHMFDTKVSLSIEKGYSAREEVMLACYRYSVPVFDTLQDHVDYAMMRFLEQEIGVNLLKHTS